MRADILAAEKEAHGLLAGLLSDVRSLTKSATRACRGPTVRLKRRTAGAYTDSNKRGQRFTLPTEQHRGRVSRFTIAVQHELCEEATLTRRGTQEERRAE